MSIHILKVMFVFNRSFIKKHERYIKWQQVKSSGNQWQRVLQWVTTKGSEWYDEWHRVVQQVTSSDNEWQRVTTNDNEW